MSMKDMGIVQGDALQAVPLVVGKDTVYVHTDIELLPDDDERGVDNYQYHEIQYDKDEYILLMAEQNIEANKALIILMGGADDELD